MRPSHRLPKVQRSPVKPYRKDLGLLGSPQPAADLEHPLGDEALERLEAWGYRDGDDSFGELALRDEALRRLEEVICIGHGDDVTRPPNWEAWTEMPAAPVPRAPDREHPLWDRQMDG
jgi:hypothetical protein